eukprot:3269196-Lingulodinium_polyedra.AAC.1
MTSRGAGVELSAAAPARRRSLGGGELLGLVVAGAGLRLRCARGSGLLRLGSARRAGLGLLAARLSGGGGAYWCAQSSLQHSGSMSAAASSHEAPWCFRGVASQCCHMRTIISSYALPLKFCHGMLHFAL